jgi:hypothetical protein
MGEFYSLDAAQASLRDVMEKLRKGTVDIRKVRAIKDVARAAIEVARTKYTLLRTLDGSGGLIAQANPCEPVALPEKILPERDLPEATFHCTATGYEQVITRENGLRVRRHVLV